MIGDHNVNMLPNIHTEFTADAVLIDAKKLDEDAGLLSIFAHSTSRFLVVGCGWPERKQIEVMVLGAAGYCEQTEPAELLKRALESILKGEIWLRRALVPKVIEALTSARQIQGGDGKSQDFEELLKLFETLSAREMEVAQMIAQGENNKRIALILNISERTVKAHLSSIFRKLNIDDRLHLAIFLKEIEQHRR